MNIRSYILVISILAIFNTGFSQNYVTTFCGTGSPGFVNGDTSIASFNRPFGICIDDLGNLYLADAYNHCIRMIGTDGQVSTFAGTGTPGYSDGPADIAMFNQPINVCFDDEGNMYVSDFLNQRIRKIDTELEVTTIAGSGVAGYQNGPSGQAQFNYPRGICVDDTGNIYIGDSWNHRIRKISTTGIVSDWAGGGTSIGVQSVGDYVDDSDTAARFYTPCELSIDQANNIFVADAYNHRIRKIDPSRMVTTHAGSGGFGPNGGGFQNGPVDQAQFDVPTACHVTLDGTVFVGDGSNQRVRKISTGGMVTTFAGSGDTGFDNGPDTMATFDFPRGTVVDYSLKRLYVVDYNNHAIRIIFYDQITEISNTDQQEIVFYPNPVHDNLYISIPNNAISQIRIFDSSGQLHKSVTINSGKLLEINLSDLVPGIYYVHLSGQEHYPLVKKILVTHD